MSKDFDINSLPEHERKFLQDYTERAGTKLDPDLKERIVDVGGGMLFVRHPLVVTLYVDDGYHNHLLNTQLAEKRKRAQESWDSGDWHQYVFWHERPFRTQAFQEVIEDDAIGDKEYWQLLAEVWVDQENPDDFPEIWYPLFSASRHGDLWMMDAEEFEAFLSLPDELTVYRGAPEEHAEGLSWTTDRKVAEFFAKRYGADDTVLQRTRPKTDFLAFFTRRGESELIMDPRLIPGSEAYL